MKSKIISAALFAITSAFLISSCGNNKEENEEKKTPPVETNTFNPYENSKFTVQVFKVDSIEENGLRGWGYNILIDGQPYIHQPNIPAVMGNAGFSSEEKARKAGEFIIYKIKNNVIPPAVTPEELDSIEVLN